MCVCVQAMCSYTLCYILFSAIAKEKHEQHKKWLYMFMDIYSCGAITRFEQRDFKRKTFKRETFDAYTHGMYLFSS